MGKRWYHRSNLYHLFPIDQITSVKKRGLITDHDPKKLGRLWLCERWKVEQIARHLHDLRPHHWQFILCEIPRWKLTEKLSPHASNAGVYIYRGNIPITSITLLARVTVMADGSGVENAKL